MKQKEINKYKELTEFEKKRLCKNKTKCVLVFDITEGYPDIQKEINKAYKAMDSGDVDKAYEHIDNAYILASKYNLL